VRKVPVLVTLELADVTGRMVAKFQTTPNHPFYVRGKGFVQAAELGIGSQIVSRAGPDLFVASKQITNFGAGRVVYNFEVEGHHTYFVGTAGGGVWVHNPKDCFPATPGEMDDFMGFQGTRSGNPSNKTTWESADGLRRYRFEEHPLKPGEIYNPRHHGPHFHVDIRPPGVGWSNKQVGKLYPPGYVNGEGSGFLPGEEIP
jgi:hypothetical protein